MRRSIVRYGRVLLGFLVVAEGIGLSLYAIGFHGFATTLLLEVGAREERVSRYDRAARRDTSLLLQYVVERSDAHHHQISRRARWIVLPLDGVLSGDMKRMTREARHPWFEPFRADDRPVIVINDDASWSTYFTHEAPEIAHCAGGAIRGDRRTYEARRRGCPRSAGQLSRAALDCMRLYGGHTLVIGCEPATTWEYSLPGATFLLPRWKSGRAHHDVRDLYTWWSTPLRLVGFPIAVALDVVTMPVQIVVALNMLRALGGP